MYELSGKIKTLSVDFQTNKALLTVEINEKQSAFRCFDELKSKDKLAILIDEYREKRSKAANAYFWKLCGELAEKASEDGIKITKDDIYRNAVKEVGVWYDDEIEPDKVKRRCTAWEMIGTGWITERVDFTPDGNKEIIRFYYGSSRYNKKQMSRLIDSVVQDCKAVGIETKTPNEIANMISLWGE